MTRIAFGLVYAAAGVGILFASACDKQSPTPSASGGGTPAAKTAGLPDGLFLTAQPAAPKTVEEVRSSAKVGDQVTIRGRVGGSVAPFVDGRAVFTIVGPGLKACSDTADDKCATPWDYCCDPADVIAKHSATIQVVDVQGAPVRTNLRGANGIKELSDLIVTGKVVQMTDKSLLINASGIHVAKS